MSVREYSASFVPPPGIECADVTARRVHQLTVIAVAAAALVIGGPLGAALLALDGAVMLVGRFWGPADVVRQLVWRVAEPRGWLRPNLVPEDLGTRRVARAIGGVWLLATAALVLAGQQAAAAALAAPLGLMMALDATANFCVLCFVRFQAQRARLLLSR